MTARRTRTPIGKAEIPPADLTTPVPEPGSELTTQQLLITLGNTGLNRWGGWITDEFQIEFRDPVRWRQTVGEMRRHPALAAALFAIEMLTRQVDWFVEPAQDAPNQDEAQRWADTMQGALSDMSIGWEDILSEILSMLPYGWSFLEMTYKIRKGPQKDSRLNSKFNDGLWGWRKWSIRAQDTLMRWEFDDDGGLRGMWQQGPPDFSARYIPIEKALLFRTRSRKQSPEGEALFYPAWRPWYFAKNLENIEGIGAERDLAGLPMMKVPSDILDANAPPAAVALRNQLATMLRRIRQDEEAGPMIPSDRDENGHPLYEFTLLGAPGAKQFDIGAILQRKAVEMLEVFLADFIVVGHEKVGSFSLATSKVNLFTTALGSFLDSIASVITEFAFRRLLELNNVDMAYCPTLKHGDIDARDLGEMGAFLKNLADSGAPLFPNYELLKFLLEQAGLPAPAEEEEPISIPADDPGSRGETG